MTKPDDIFLTTRWTLVMAAGQDSTQQSMRALEEICSMYWFPLYSYVRRRGHTKEDAEDLTQAFFHQLLEHRWLEDADRSLGRLRAFLITALKRFMAKEWRKAGAKKRGGGQIHLSMDAELAEGRYATVDDPSIDAEALFDRQWALTILDLTIRHLEKDYEDTGRGKEFSVLKAYLVNASHNVDFASIMEKLDMNEGAARVAVHRLRKRFRKRYREEVAQTLPEGADLDSELGFLAKSLM